MRRSYCAEAVRLKRASSSERLGPGVPEPAASLALLHPHDQVDLPAVPMLGGVTDLARIADEHRELLTALETRGIDVADLECGDRLCRVEIRQRWPSRQSGFYGRAR